MRPVPYLVLLAAFARACSADALALEGRVLDQKTHAGIANATVMCGGPTVLSDQAGYFSAECRAATLMVRAAGYRATQYPSAQTAHGTIVTLEPFTPRALYLTVYGIGSKQLREGALALVRKGYANALVIDVKGDRGILPYPSNVPLSSVASARPITTIRDLPGLVKSLHQQNIYLIARIVVFKDDPLATARRDLAVTRADGSLFRDREGLAWTDPFKPEVRDYNIAVAVEAARAGFDEVQFDYVRFPDVSGALRFAQPATAQSRAAAIRQFLREARERLAGFNCYVALDIFGYVCWNTNDTGIGQVLEEVAPLVDYISPMLYPSGFQFGIPGLGAPVTHPYEIVRLTLENARKRVGLPAVRFRPWLQAFRDYAFDRRPFQAHEVQEQVRAARDFGADGYMLWNAQNRYDDAFAPPSE